jgi:hypothetical protein
MTTHTINLGNIKVTNAIASLINSAFETGLNPAWYEVESLNDNGFLDASFEDSNLETPSKKPAKTDWSVKVRLVDDDGDPVDDMDYTVVTPALACQRLNKMANDTKLKFLRSKADAFLRYLVALDEATQLGRGMDYAEQILFDEYEPDGVHDDALTQYIVFGDVIFG